MEISQEIITESFLGKPYEAKLKGDDGVEYEFYVEQFTVEDLPDFKSIVEDYVKMKNKESEMSDSEFLKKCIPLVKKMMDLSYPDWKKENRERFVQKNIMTLVPVMIMANSIMMTAPLFNQTGKEDMEKFILEERKKRECKDIVPGKAES